MRPARARGFLALILVAVAIAAAIAALPSPSAAASGYASAYSGWVSNGTIQSVNGNNVIFTLPPTATSLHITVQSASYPTQEVTVSPGNPFYYYDALLINVVQIDNNRSQAYVDIQKPVVTATPAPTGTKVYCDTPGQYVKAGDQVTFPIVIQNYDADRTYTLSASNDASWTTGFQYNGKDIYQIFVPQGQSRTVNLVVKTLYTTPVGERGVTARADDYGLGLKVSVTSANSSADVSTRVGSVIAALGDKVYYDVTINNKQSEDNGYQLSVSGLPDGWYYRYVETRGSAAEMAEAIVPASGSKSIVLEIVPALSATEGDYAFAALITTPDNVTVTKDLTLKLKGSVSMAVDSDKLAYTARAGQSFNVVVYVTNDGKGDALTNVYADVTAPTGWTVSTSPATVNSIKAGETCIFTVSLVPPANIVPSDYSVKVAVKSDQKEEPSEYRITVTADSLVPYIGGAIVLAIVGSLGLIYRKYGRR